MGLLDDLIGSIDLPGRSSGASKRLRNNLRAGERLLAEASAPARRSSGCG